MSTLYPSISPPAFTPSLHSPPISFSLGTILHSTSTVSYYGPVSGAGAGVYPFSGGIQDAAAGGAVKVVNEAVSSLAGLASVVEGPGELRSDGLGAMQAEQRCQVAGENKF
jgi:hypothetical protein